MPRKPRPINPSEGPLQAFAYDLRMVREAAGNPTYRTLAVAAGFSATTLSDAAGGVRKPSLEVTLAYVGACRGDVKLWEKRWYELDRLLAEVVEPDGLDEPSPPVTEKPDPLPDPEPDLDPDPDQGEGQDSQPRASRTRQWVGLVRRTRFLWPATAATGALAVAGGLLTMAPTTWSADGHGCTYHGGGAFTGRTYQPVTRIRDSAALGGQVLREVPSGCALPLTGFCLGETVTDETSGTPDLRWFEIAGGGLVASAVIHGNTPSDMKPSACPGGVPEPALASLSFVPPTAGGEAVGLRAGGVQVGIVGYAAYYADSGQEAKWHQLGFTASGADGFPAVWQLGMRVRPSAGAAIPVVAVACYGGDGPSGVVAALGFVPESPTLPQAVTLDPADLARAKREGCRYPKN